MTRYRLQPTLPQQAGLAEHCAHARFVWNLAIEQHSWWRPGRRGAPGSAAQYRELSEARSEFAWLAAGSVIVQQQALRDFHQAMTNFFRGTLGRPSWRKAGRNEGFRIVNVKAGDVRRLSRRVGAVRVPKVGWVRFRWTRPVPTGVKSYRITCDRAGRWHIAFAIVPPPIPAPGNGMIVGIDRGVAVSAALSTGEMLACPQSQPAERRRKRRLQRRLVRARRGSIRRARVRQAIARLKAREADRRKDWVEKVSTSLARCFDVIAVEDLRISAMTRSAKGTRTEPGRNVRQKAGLNRGILANGWGMLVQRLEHKAFGRVEKVDPAYTSQRCSVCGSVDAKARESQAVFACRSCAYTCNADVNAASNIRDTAAGRAVAAREGPRATGPAHREPQPVLLPA